MNMYLPKKPFRAALILTALLGGGCESAFAPQPTADPEAIFEDLWTSFDRNYAGFADREVDWNALYQEHRPRVTSGTSDAALFEILSDLLMPLNDSHVSLSSRDRLFLSSRYDRDRSGMDRFDIDMIKQRYLEPNHRSGPGGSWVYGLLRERNVGYLHVREIQANFAVLEQLLDQNPTADGYVIDLRQNTGGNHTHAFATLGRLTDRPRFVFRSRTKSGGASGQFTPWHEWHIRPRGRHVDRPIVVLTDRRTPSAAERTVMAFRTLPNVTVVGDTTSGSISTKIARELANGWYYSLSPQQVEMFDGRSYEGRGLPPDIVVRNDADDVRAGVDRVLETAIAQLRRAGARSDP